MRSGRKISALLVLALVFGARAVSAQAPEQRYAKVAGLYVGSTRVFQPNPFAGVGSGRASGRGKASLVGILWGLVLPHGGEVRWQGGDIKGLREEYSKQLVFVGHASALKDELTAAENLAVTCTLAGLRANEEKVRGALQVFGLGGQDDLVKKLSHGQRRRAQLAPPS